MPATMPTQELYDQLCNTVVRLAGEAIDATDHSTTWPTDRQWAQRNALRVAARILCVPNLEDGHEWRFIDHLDAIMAHADFDNDNALEAVMIVIGRKPW